MSDDVERGGSGRFAKGQSGNPQGARIRRRRELMSLEDIHRTILRVAASPTQVVISGKTHDVTMLEANFWGLASGKPSNRLASKDVIELATSAGQFMARLEREEAQRAQEQARRELYR